MKIKLLGAFALLFIALWSQGGTVVTNIEATYHDGQTFIVWDVIPGYAGFYYVYRFDHPITKTNIDSSKYMGKVPHDFSFNYFLNYGTNPGTFTRYFVINRDPLDSLDATKGLFVATCAKAKTFYYAVTSDSLDQFGDPVENRFISPGSNALTTGVNEKVEPVQAILQVDNLPLLDDPNKFYDAWVVFGGNVKTKYTPAMANEGCLPFNFGIVPDSQGVELEKKAATMFFYGGAGNAYSNVNSTKIPGMWKISMEDAIPNFSWDPLAGENTKWIGYNENFDVYNANEDTPPPTTGIDKSYTISRVKWTLDWVMKTYPILDSTRIYAHASSSGCTGALALTFNYPDRIAACDVVNAKLNAEYLNDDNPDCKWNEDGSSRHRAEIFLGTQADNLPSDIPKFNGSGTYPMYDWANFDILLSDSKYRSLPLIFLTSGKEDIITCWDEKIPYYKAVNQSKAGGFYYWDRRSHKGGNHAISDRPLELMFRYRTDLSYPAFSNCTLNGYPGDTHNPNPPYYDGDTVGTVNGNLDWVDSTIYETPNSWQTVVYSYLFQLVNNAYFPYSGLPEYIKTDITPRRLQQFKNIPDGSTICMENWEGPVLKQSREITYHAGPNGNALITFRKVKIRSLYADGNLIKIYNCGSPKLTTTQVIHTASAIDNIYPNPTSGYTTIDLSMIKEAEVIITVSNILGEQVMQVNQGVVAEGEQQVGLDLTQLSPGIYIVNINSDNQRSSYKVIKE